MLAETALPALHTVMKLLSSLSAVLYLPQEPLQLACSVTLQLQKLLSCIPTALFMLDDCKLAINHIQHGDGGLLKMQAMVQLLLHSCGKHED